MNHLFTPVELVVLLKCHYSAQPGNGLRPTPANARAVAKWLGLGCIVPHPERADVYDTTPRGAAMVNTLCNTPLPL
jgi:hypothetical protein